MKLQIFSYPSILTNVLGTQKNGLNEFFCVPTIYVLVESEKFKKMKFLAWTLSLKDWAC